MTLTIDLPADLEQRLKREAERRGLPLDACTLELLKSSLPSANHREAAGALLQSWIDEDDAGEQRETGDFLIAALNEDRPSDRALFPPDLQGVTW